MRPRVIARKISGRTRSPAGSKTTAGISSLFETERLRGKNGLEACRAMLIAFQKPAATPAFWNFTLTALNSIQCRHLLREHGTIG